MSIYITNINSLILKMIMYLIILSILSLLHTSAFLDRRISWYNTQFNQSKDTNNLKYEEFDLLHFTLNDQSWWLMEQTSNSAFDPFRDEKIYLRKVNLDEQLIHSCYEYRIMFINPSGLETDDKHGFFCYPAIIITGMPKCSTSALYSLLSKVPGVWLSHVKENCPFTSKSILHWFDSHPTSLKIGQLYVDACIDLPGNMIIRRLLRNPQTFYIVLTRDFSSWLWSAYNYWCNDTFEKECDIRHHYAEINVHSRSPSEFDSIVKNSLNNSGVPTILGSTNICQLGKYFYKTYIQLLLNEGIPENKYIVLASEELSSNIQSFWNKLALVSGLPMHHKDINFSQFNNFRYNTQSYKGADHKVPIEEFQDGLYPISLNQPMFNDTRKILDSCWIDDCKWISNQAAYNFRACSNENSNNLNSIRSIYNQPEKFRENLDGYIHRAKDFCLKRHLQHKEAFEKIRVQYEVLREKVFFFSVNKAVREDFMLLVQNAVGSNITLDISSLDSISSDNYKLRKESCKKAYVLGVDPKKSKTFEDLKYFIVKEYKRVCFLNITDQGEEVEKQVAIRSIVYSDISPKSLIWQKFIKSNPSEYELLEQKHSFFSWMKWDSDVLKLTENLAKEYSLLESIKSPYVKQFIEVDLYGKKREALLATLFNHMRLPKYALENLACDYMQLFTERNLTLEEKAVVASAQYIDAAFSSDEALCSLQKHSFLGNKEKNASCDSLGEGKYPYDMCKLRYSQKRYYDLNEFYKYVPTALLSVDRHEINVRLLVEYAVGIYSGTSNAAVKNMFHADHYCGQRMALNYVNPDIVTIKITKAGHRTIHINKEIRKKCLKGLIRGFSRGILVVDDPFLVVYPTVLRHLALHNNSTKDMDDEAIRHLALAVTNDFNRTVIFPHREIKLASEMMQSADEYRMITYESLFNPDMRVSVLKALASFLRFEKVDDQRITCAFSFIDRKTFSDIEVMLATYRKEEKLVCYMNHIFASKLNGTDIHFRLFSDYKKSC